MKTEEKHSNISQSSKLSARFKAFECKKREYDEANTTKDMSTKEDPELLHRDKKMKVAPSEKEESSEESVIKEEKNRGKEREKKHGKMKKEDSRNITPKKEKKKSPSKAVDETKETTTRKVTPKREIKDTPKKEHKSKPGKRLSSNIEIEVKKETPKKESPKKVEGGTNGHTKEELTPQDEKKKNAREAYLKFLRRSGPANPGSKVIPEVRSWFHQREHTKFVLIYYRVHYTTV